MIPDSVLFHEDNSLGFLQDRIVVVQSINRAIKSIDIGKCGASGDLLEKAKVTLMKSTYDPKYVAMKLGQIQNLEKIINNALYKEKPLKTEADKRKEAKWDYVFSRNKRYIPLYPY